MQFPKTVYVVDGCRTPFLKARGRPGPFTAADLAVAAGRPLLARHGFDPGEIDEVILGNVVAGADEANIARIVTLRLGLGDQVPAWTVHRNCASGMQAVDTAATDIALGRASLVLAGGVEAMSHIPILWSRELAGWLGGWTRARTPTAKLRALAGLRPAHFKPVIALLRGLRDPVTGLTMGQTAENVARRFAVTRDAMDEFALHSHRRLADAMDHGRLGEVHPLFDAAGRVHDADDGLRRDTTVEKLAALKPVFDPGVGSVTAGNSAQVTDGAALLLLADEAAVRRHNFTVLGRIVDSEWAALDPAHMGLGPVHSSAPLLRRNKLRLGDVDCWEINEAFAAQVLGCIAAFRDRDYCRAHLGADGAIGELSADILNVDGGSVAIGHPVGASGARIVLHLLHALAGRNAKCGVAAICIGGGQGGSMLLESNGAGAAAASTPVTTAGGSGTVTVN